MTTEQARAKMKPNWSAEVRFPQTIRVLKPVANEVFGIGAGIHEIVIRRPDQEVPALIVQWMQGDPRYRTWFLQQDEPIEESPVAVEVEDEPDKPKRQRRKKAADDGEE